MTEPLCLDVIRQLNIDILGQSRPNEVSSLTPIASPEKYLVLDS